MVSVRYRRFLFMALLFAPAWAQGAELSAFVDHDTIALDHTLQLSVRLSGSDSDFQLDTTPLDRDFYVIVKSPTHKSGAWFEKHYQLGPKHTGTLTIPALHARHGGRTFVSRPFQVRMLARRGEVDDARIWIETRVNNRHVWQRQQVRYDFVVYSTDPFVGVPHLTPPGFTGFQVRVLRSKAAGERVIAGRRVRTLSYAYLLFPQRAGELRIDAPRIAAEVVQFARIRRIAAGMKSFGEKKRIVRFKRATGAVQKIEVEALPAAARDLPVGRLSLVSKVSEARVVAGEPLTWSLRLEGESMPAAALPRLGRFMEVSGDVKLYPEAPVVSERMDDRGLHSRVLWRVVALPQHAGVIDLASVRTRFFDPQRGRILRVRTEPVHLPVSPPAAPERKEVFRAAAPPAQAAVSTMAGVSVWWRRSALALLLLWVTTAGLWFMRGHRWSTTLQRRRLRRISRRRLDSASNSAEQFAALKELLGLPARISPLGMLEKYPELRQEAAGSWLLDLERGLYGSGDLPGPLRGREIRNFLRLVRNRRAKAVPIFRAAEFGRSP